MFWKFETTNSFCCCRFNCHMSIIMIFFSGTKGSGFLLNWNIMDTAELAYKRTCGLTCSWIWRTLYEAWTCTAIRSYTNARREWCCDPWIDSVSDSQSDHKCVNQACSCKSTRLWCYRVQLATSQCQFLAHLCKRCLKLWKWGGEPTVTLPVLWSNIGTDGAERDQWIPLA